MLEHHASRSRGVGDGLEAGERRAAEHVLHVHGLARTEEGPVEDGVGTQRPTLLGDRQVEPPGLDALVPARVDEAEIVGRLRDDEQAVVGVAQCA